MPSKGSARWLVGMAVFVATGSVTLGTIVREPPSMHAAAAHAQFPELGTISPVEGSTVCSRPKVMVALRLNDALRTRGAFDVSRVQLVLDRIDITHKTTIVGTLDYPQGTASLSYTPAKPLRRGTHRVMVRYASPGGLKAYAWTFLVAGIPCR